MALSFGREERWSGCCTLRDAQSLLMRAARSGSAPLWSNRRETFSLTMTAGNLVSVSVADSRPCRGDRATRWRRTFPFRSTNMIENRVLWECLLPQNARWRVYELGVTRRNQTPFRCTSWKCLVTQSRTLFLRAWLRIRNSERRSLFPMNELALKTYIEWKFDRKLITIVWAPIADL